VFLIPTAIREADVSKGLEIYMALAWEGFSPVISLTINRFMLQLTQIELQETHVLSIPIVGQEVFVLRGQGYTGLV
jgi:hypothetical protein